MTIIRRRITLTTFSVSISIFSKIFKNLLTLSSMMTFLLLIAVSAMTIAESSNQSQNQAISPVGPQLTSKLKGLLRQEMQHILAAHQQILSAMIVGDHDTVAEQAQQIHDSFILKQSLTEQDRKDLMTAVPPQFVELDRSFHTLAEKLAQAAARHDNQKEVAYFNQMTAACVECHSRFAIDRFPGLAKK